MMSHDLARELLARRNNDVRVRVILDDDPTGKTYTTQLIELQDADPTIDPDLRTDPVVAYDATHDVIVIYAGCVVIGAGDDE